MQELTPPADYTSVISYNDANALAPLEVKDEYAMVSRLIERIGIA